MTVDVPVNSNGLRAWWSAAAALFRHAWSRRRGRAAATARIVTSRVAEAVKRSV